MTVEILVATMNGALQPQDLSGYGARVLVIDQVVGNVQGPHDASADDRLRTLRFAERGLSRSRNRAIENALGDFCVIADDDVSFVDELAIVVEGAYKDNPDADVITFQGLDEHGRLRKSFRSRPYWHNWKSVTGVSSIEITFRRKRIIAAGIRFDERFGLGSEYVSGEESIFLMDCLRAGLRVLYLPVPISIHPGQGSGAQFQDRRLSISKGAVLRRMYRGWSLPMVFAFLASKAVKRQANPARLLPLMLRGWREFGEVDRGS